MSPIFDFVTIPVIETARCRLRQITHADAPALLAHFGHPNTVRHLDMEPMTREDEASAMIDWLTDLYAKRAGVRWAITLPPTDRLIGTCGFHRYDPVHRRTEIGYDLHPDHWGSGYMTEITHALARWCFENLDLHRIVADCNAGNTGSARVLEKVGFTHEGTWRDHAFEKGHFVSLKQYGLLRHEYLPA